jgi:hypothetical protein
VIVAIAAIMVWRAGKVTRAQVPELVELLLEAEGGKIVIQEADEVADDGPPAVAPPGSGPSGDGSVSLTRSSVGFEQHFGRPPGDAPESYWQPWLGRWCGLFDHATLAI